MAKKQKKAKGLIPKKIAGVKVPRSVRKGRFGELLASKTGQAVIAQAILGAGAVAAGMKAKESPKVRKLAKDAGETVSDTAHDARRQAADAGANLAYAVGLAARTFVDALREGEPRSFRSSGEAEAERWTPDYGAPDPVARRKGAASPIARG
ncbi:MULTISPECIES: hypothetical protein [unclassified Phenylobacterium]|uniref:hypothetical protein n=1 Tax=unclassified Phenylobacterium TaxID=2640670 RepID=UPI00083ADDBD|nr:MULTISPECIES: hypothetical protein [unclassified Phenylobacterium]